VADMIVVGEISWGCAPRYTILPKDSQSKYLPYDEILLISVIQPLNDPVQVF
jgi:hypothetical protein